ncbi:MAG: hypothetical protein E7184_00250 [Erysipelotrichaceae bacterium]|nr:hypothetical protein [Erysipelotrichaceae bacterium]
MEDYSYIICPNSIKEKILKTTTDILHLKFIDKSALLKNTYFDYDYRAIYYLHQKYNYKFDNAKEILDNLINLSPKNEKLAMLENIYKELVKKELLIFNPHFSLSFNNYKIKILGYSQKDEEIKSALNNLNLQYEYLQEDNQIYKHQFITFNNIDDEVLYVFNQIAKLVEKGTSLNNIYLYKLPSEYNLIVKKLSHYYNLPIENLETIKLYDSPIYKEFIDLLLELGYQQAYQKLANEIAYDSLSALPKLANILIKLSSLKLDKEELLPILNYVAKNTTLKNVTYSQSIKICDETTTINNDDYIFMLGFSLNDYPHICKDTDFLNDQEKTIVKKNTSILQNQINKELLKKFISHHQNIIITFKKKLGKIEYTPSLLVEELALEKKEGLLDNKRYSKEYTMLETANYKDMYYKYHVVSKYIDEFKESIEYKNFSHHFKGIVRNEDKLFLSYSQLNEYYKCAFMFFIKRVLKANIFEESFEIKLGSLFHTILEDSLTKSINLKDYQTLIKETFTTNKELFFVELLLPQIETVLEKIRDFHNTTQYSCIKGEYEFKYQLDQDTTIVGKADKIMIDEENKKAIVIDYKTGKDTFESYKVNYGLNMQLPLYATLIKDQFPNIELTGMFLQNILADTRENDLEEINKLYLLSGICVNDSYSFKRLDPSIGTEVDENGKTIKNSKFIKGCKISKNDSITGCTEKEKFNKLIDTAFNKTKEASISIKNNQFSINPKAESYQLNHLPCKYCECFDICFRKTKDIVIIKKDKEGDK